MTYPDQPSRLNRGLPAEKFLKEHWGKQSLVVLAAFDGLDGIVEPDDLAGAACESESDARIVVGGDEAADWVAEQGPFDETTFENLPESQWTLLVQGVDAWNPQVAALKDAFDFLPAWCLDDVMVSFSAAGGGVGPHFDQYDVFLIQAGGRRRWRLGQRCSDATPLADNTTLKLLDTFHETQVHDLGPGDMLYVPAGVAHWGTALDDDCITCSVGFRAPSHRELLHMAVDAIADSLDEGQRCSVGEEGAEGDQHLIGEATLNRLNALWANLETDAVQAALLGSFGSLVTEQRSSLHIEDDESGGGESQLVRQRDGALRIRMDSATRMAYSHTPSGATLFVNGEEIPTTLAVAQAICSGNVRAELADDAAFHDVLAQLEIP
jgi:50S ribosomal protein L16 3-hydroxylase